jgi:hypothetical protein
MVNFSCILCFYSDEDEIATMIGKYTNGKKNMRCSHPNSPNCDELVHEDMTCRLFLDEREYFAMKDRREKLERLKDLSQGRLKK